MPRDKQATQKIFPNSSRVVAGLLSFLFLAPFKFSRVLLNEDAELALNPDSSSRQKNKNSNLAQL